MLTAIDPTTGRTLLEVPEDPLETVERKVEAAHAAASTWRDASFADRAAMLHEVARLLRERTDRYAARMTSEMGKPRREAVGEVGKTAWACEHFAEHAEAYLADEVLPSDATDSRVRYLPLGPVLGVLPWNSPFWLAARVFAPALMAGNPVLIKHDAHTPGCAADLAELFADAGAPHGVFDVVYAGHEVVEKLLRDVRIRAVSLTGSTRAGRAVGRVAGDEIKPVVLELGGSDPAIVLSDADLDAAAETLTTSRMINAGQSCIAAKRILVHEDVHDALVGKLEAHISQLTVGDPADPATQIGPMARVDLRDALHAQVRDSVAEGATCVLGGEVPPGDGAFYPPTLLTDVQPEMRVCREETFGPVAVVARVGSAEEALERANDTPWGLAASVWSADLDLAHDLARRLEAGQVAINGLVKTDPRLPSGGVKRSGLGRELGPHGIRMFVNAQQLWVGPRRA